MRHSLLAKPYEDCSSHVPEQSKVRRLIRHTRKEAKANVVDQEGPVGEEESEAFTRVEPDEEGQHLGDLVSGFEGVYRFDLIFVFAALVSSLIKTPCFSGALVRVDSPLPQQNSRISVDQPADPHLW